MIINREYTFPRHFPAKQSKEKLWLKVFSMAFVREIGRNGILNSGIWSRHGVSNQIESNWYIRKSIAINQIEKKGISMISLSKIVPYESYRIEKYIN